MAGGPIAMRQPAVIRDLNIRIQDPHISDGDLER
jgi:hypothetical protein